MSFAYPNQRCRAVKRFLRDVSTFALSVSNMGINLTLFFRMEISDIGTHAHIAWLLMEHPLKIDSLGTAIFSEFPYRIFHMFPRTLKQQHAAVEAFIIALFHWCQKIMPATWHLFILLLRIMLGTPSTFSLLLVRVWRFLQIKLLTVL